MVDLILTQDTNHKHFKVVFFKERPNLWFKKTDISLHTKKVPSDR